MGEATRNPSLSWSFWLWAVVWVFITGAAGYLWKGSPKSVWPSPEQRTAQLERDFAPGAAQGRKSQVGAAGNAGSANGGTGTASEADTATSGAGATREQVLALAERLDQHLKDNPADTKAWALLGRTRMALDEAPQAVAAYRKATALEPQDADLWADRADAEATAQGRKLDGEPAQFIARALQIDPNNLKALALAGTVAYQQDDYAGALRHWEHALRVGPPEHPLMAMIKNAAAQARERSGGATASAKAGTKAGTEAGAEAISGRVSLAPALAAKAKPDDVVFVIARSSEGPGLPLAVLRLQVKDLPAPFSLGDHLAMSPAAKLSGAKQVQLIARVSKSGEPMPKPGDLEGRTGALSPGSNAVELVISQVR